MGMGRRSTVWTVVVAAVLVVLVPPGVGAAQSDDGAEQTLTFIDGVYTFDFLADGSGVAGGANRQLGPHG